MLHGHGDEGYLYQQPIKANFSSNVNYTGLNKQLKAYLFDQFDTINNYPEVNSESLQQAIAAKYSLAKEQVLVTNGGTEAFYLIAQAYATTSATILVPSFSEYEDACKLNAIALTFLTYPELTSASLFQTKLVFICNPNNPTGKAIANSMLEILISNNSNCLFIVDEAYIDFTLQSTSLANGINEFPNLLIVKSLTKTYSIPGLRLGYILSSRAIVDKITTYKMPWSVNTLAIAAGRYILQHQQALQLPLTLLLKETQQLIDQLNTIATITAYPTHTHFFLCEIKKGTAADLKIFLLNTYGFLIRDASNFKTLTTQHFRIATQTQEHNAELINGIEAWTQQLQ